MQAARRRDAAGARPPAPGRHRPAARVRVEPGQRLAGARRSASRRRWGSHPVSQTEDDALLDPRAMVAAAAADGQIDAAERARIAQGMRQAGIDEEATRWLESELAEPADVEELAAGVETPEKAAQVYTAGRCLAIYRNFIPRSARSSPTSRKPSTSISACATRSTPRPRRRGASAHRPGR